MENRHGQATTWQRGVVLRKLRKHRVLGKACLQQGWREEKEKLPSFLVIQKSRQTWGPHAPISFCTRVGILGRKSTVPRWRTNYSHLSLWHGLRWACLLRSGPLASDWSHPPGILCQRYSPEILFSWPVSLNETLLILQHYLKEWLGREDSLE